uniref:39S ribosomal protein L52, mitochondrial n=1 Tax=Macrostomum lignano TaxID=282301 RepID=A0A1I8JQB8_9PLAT
GRERRRPAGGAGEVQRRPDRAGPGARGSQPARTSRRTRSGLAREAAQCNAVSPSQSAAPAWAPPRVSRKAAATVRACWQAVISGVAPASPACWHRRQAKQEVDDGHRPLAELFLASCRHVRKATPRVRQEAQDAELAGQAGPVSSQQSRVAFALQLSFYEIDAAAFWRHRNRFSGRRRSCRLSDSSPLVCRCFSRLRRAVLALGPADRHRPPSGQIQTMGLPPASRQLGTSGKIDGPYEGHQQTVGVGVGSGAQAVGGGGPVAAAVGAAVGPTTPTSAPYSWCRTARPGHPGQPIWRRTAAVARTLSRVASTLRGLLNLASALTKHFQKSHLRPCATPSEFLADAFLDFGPPGAPGARHRLSAERRQSAGIAAQRPSNLLGGVAGVLHGPVDSWLTEPSRMRCAPSAPTSLPDYGKDDGMPRMWNQDDGMPRMLEQGVGMTRMWNQDCGTGCWQTRMWNQGVGMTRIVEFDAHRGDLDALSVRPSRPDRRAEVAKAEELKRQYEIRQQKFEQFTA